jgi:hypothetical protein
MVVKITKTIPFLPNNQGQNILKKRGLQEHQPNTQKHKQLNINIKSPEYRISHVKLP